MTRIENACAVRWLFLYEDRNGIERLMCVDVATRRRVENALREGGRFVKKGEF